MLAWSQGLRGNGPVGFAAQGPSATAARVGFGAQTKIQIVGRASPSLGLAWLCCVIFGEVGLANLGFE